MIDEHTLTQRQARRFFRLHKWVDCWSTAQTQASAEQDDIRKILSVAKSSLLGMYFFLEMTTIVRIYIHHVKDRRS